MTPAQRIALNTSTTYCRSLLGMALGLFSSRWVLEALGASDFGLYGVVGAIIVFIGFFSGALNSSIARFYAVAIGADSKKEESDGSELCRWFSAALCINLFLPLVLIAVGYPIGVYCIHNYLTIPPDRIDACVWVFRIALVTSFVTLATQPFVALYTAHQYISELALFGIFSSLMTCLCAYFLLGASGDRLIIYAGYMMLIHAGIPIVQVIRACYKFRACRFWHGLVIERRCMLEIFSFAGWQLFGAAGAVLRGQGTAILINLNFGPTVNASYSVAGNLAGQSATLSQALIGALQPALATTEGAGNRERTIRLAVQSCKFSLFLVLLFAIPLMLEMPEVLRLWLKTPPAYSSQLCVLMILVLLIDKMTVGYMMAIAAQGRVAAYQAFLGGALIMTLPLVALFFYLGGSPVSAGYAFIVTMLCCSLGRLYFAKHQLGIAPEIWVKKVFVPIGIASVISACCGHGVQLVCSPSLLRVLAVSTLTLAVTVSVGWYLVLDINERLFFATQCKKFKLFKVLGK